MPKFGVKLERFKDCPYIDKEKIEKIHQTSGEENYIKEFNKFGAIWMRLESTEMKSCESVMEKKTLFDKQFVIPRNQTFIAKSGLATVVASEVSEKDRIPLSKFKRKFKNLFEETSDIESDKFLKQAFENKKPFTVINCNDQEYEEFKESGCNLGLENIKSSLNDIVPDSQGLTIPYFYVGFSKSVAPFHTEDSNLLALNVMIAGKAKDWFFIPPRCARKYEDFIDRFYKCECQPGEYCRGSNEHINRDKQCTNVASHKDVFPDLSYLKKEGIEYYTFKQLPGDVVITGPDVYHGIVNTGVNFNWAVNFSNKNWDEKYQYNKKICSCGVGDSDATEKIDSLKNAVNGGQLERYHEYCLGYSKDRVALLRNLLKKELMKNRDNVPTGSNELSERNSDPVLVVHDQVSDADRDETEFTERNSDPGLVADDQVSDAARDDTANQTDKHSNEGKNPSKNEPMWSRKRNPAYEDKFTWQGPKGYRTGIKCNVCNLLFRGTVKQSVKTKFNLHMRKVHLGIRIKYTCPQCKKIFNDNRGLQNHIGWQHDNIQFSCMFCEKIYMSKGTLKKHLKNHQHNESMKNHDNVPTGSNELT